MVQRVIIVYIYKIVNENSKIYKNLEINLLSKRTSAIFGRILHQNVFENVVI